MIVAARAAEGGVLSANAEPVSALPDPEVAGKVLGTLSPMAAVGTAAAALKSIVTGDVTEKSSVRSLGDGNCVGLVGSCLSSRQNERCC